MILRFPAICIVVSSFLGREGEKGKFEFQSDSLTSIKCISMFWHSRLSPYFSSTSTPQTKIHISNLPPFSFPTSHCPLVSAHLFHTPWLSICLGLYKQPAHIPFHECITTQNQASHGTTCEIILYFRLICREKQYSCGRLSWFVSSFICLLVRVA